jgi:hypothetical protein
VQQGLIVHPPQSRGKEQDPFGLGAFDLHNETHARLSDGPCVVIFGGSSAILSSAGASHSE